MLDLLHVRDGCGVVLGLGLREGWILVGLREGEGGLGLGVG